MSSASIRSISASRCISSSRLTSAWSSSTAARPASGGPRHRLSASPSRADAAAGSPRASSAAAVVDQPLEAGRVELVGLELEQVPAAAREQHLGALVAERPAQPGHRDVDGVGRAARPRAVEQLLDQPLGADHLVRVHEQEREQRALALATERQRLAIQGSRQRPEDPELHRGPPQRAHCDDYRPSGRDAQWGPDSACQRPVSYLQPGLRILPDASTRPAADARAGAVSNQDQAGRSSATTADGPSSR